MEFFLYAYIDHYQPFFEKEATHLGRQGATRGDSLVFGFT